MHFVVPQNCVEPPFAFEFTCARHWSVPLFAAAWLEWAPCLSVAKISTQRSAPFQRLSLAARCANRTALHLDCTAPTWAGLSVVYRAIAGKRYAETDGNKRKQVETDGNTRNSMWRFTCSGFVAVLFAKKSRFRENSPKNKNKMNNCSLCLNLRGVGDEKQPFSWTRVLVTLLLSGHKRSAKNWKYLLSDLWRQLSDKPGSTTSSSPHSLSSLISFLKQGYKGPNVTFLSTNFPQHISESVKCHFSKCSFSVELKKLEKYPRWGESAFSLRRCTHPLKSNWTINSKH